MSDSLFSDSPSTPPPSVTTTTSSWAGFKIVGDNIDKNVRPRYMRLDSQTNSLHYLHAYALKDRIDLSSFSDSHQILFNLPSSKIFEQILPSTTDCNDLNHNLAILVSLVSSRQCSVFHQYFADVAVRHISHDHSAEMSQKSTVVSCYCQSEKHNYRS